MPEHTAIHSLRQGAVQSARVVASTNLGQGPVRSLYIHVPFCAHKCHYCDFYSLVDTRDRRDAFTDRLCRELRALAPLAAGAPIETIFVGGGTPTMLTPRQWDRLLRTLHDAYDLSLLDGASPTSEAEFSVECNPETATQDLFETLREGGVNRMSFGAQSFDRVHLATLQRLHDPDSVPRAMDLARCAGITRLSLDLIHSIPGQTLDSWRRDLEYAVGLAPEHLSCYNLTYEPNTAMTARLKRGEFEPTPEDLEIDMMREAWALLTSHGYARYEISNFARHEAHCRHNLVYWRCGQWLAAGPSASGHVAGHRWKNAPRLDDYLAIDDDGFAPIVDHEPPDRRRLLRERLWLGLRLAEGVHEAEIEAESARLSPEIMGRLTQRADSLASRDLLRIHSGRWLLTDVGVLLADTVARELMTVIT